MEQYATRIIKMHDGRIVEDKEVKKVEDNIEAKTSKYNKITMGNKYRLGIRNTFNIFSKFILLFVVFLFITLAVFAEYGSFKDVENQLNQQTSSNYFVDLSPNRILIKKKDKQAFSDADYEKIRSVANIEKVVESDWILDKTATFFQSDLQNIFYGYIHGIEEFDGNLDVGRMPQNDDEVVVIASKKYFEVDKYIKGEFYVAPDSPLIMHGAYASNKIKVVGVKYSNDDDDYISHIYVSNKLLNNLIISINFKTSTFRYLFNGKYADINSSYIQTSESVKRGEIIVNDTWKSRLSKGSIKNKTVTIYVDNIFYNEELNLKIIDTYKKSNFKKINGYKENQEYSEFASEIYINEEDYNSLFYKPNYQSSVFVKDIDNIDETIQELDNIGIEAKKITDFAYYDNLSFIQMEKIVKTIVTIILILVLFFISYFIIKIILKSRNTYYTTLRMLGANFKSVRRILDIELFINSNIAYCVVLTFIWLLKMKIIDFAFAQNLVQYIEISECILVYVILIIMARLISRRFSRKLFKNTTMNTYKEEV